MAVLLEIPVGDGAVLLVEADRDDIPGRLMSASSERGAAVKAAWSLSESLEQLEPMLRMVKERLIASMPEHFRVEFGVRFGGETGIVLTKGTAEVHLKVTMIWDRAAGWKVASLGRRYETAVVRLVVWAAGRRVITGMGVLVGTRQVVTCAHVVNTSLGRDQREQARPDPSATVQVEFPLLAGAPIRTGRVQAWVPPPQCGEGDGDVAGLVLSEDAPAGATPARFTGEAGGPLRVFGYPETPPRECGAWLDVDLSDDVGGQLIRVEGRDQAIKAQLGYSGSPVWQDSTGVVVGLLHASSFADEPDQNAYLLPASLMAEAWETQFDYLLAATNPYRGLEAFTAEHARVFFGRDRDIDLLTARATAQPVVVVVGPSGVGKSSLVQAGLIPRLRELGNYSVVLVRPGQDPWQRLAAGLLSAQRGTESLVPVPESRDDVEREVERLRSEGLGPVARLLGSKDRPLLLIVDQFEELLATGQPPDPQLLDLLLRPLDATDDPTRVVITLCADHLPALLSIPGIGPRLDQRLYMLSPLTEEELRAAVQRPANARGVEFDTGLVDQIVSDTGVGALPLLQFTLNRLWNTQRHRTLTSTGYRAIGGVSGALDHFAEQQMSKLADDVVGVVDRVLPRLVHTPVPDPGLTARRRAYQSDLSVAEWDAVRHLADVRLVIVDIDHDRGPCAELAHEALISSWQRLHRLVGDNADFLGWLAWVQQRAAENDLLPEARIAQARLWIQSRADDIPDQVKAFVDGSQTTAEVRLRELSQARDRAETATRRAEALRLAADAELALRLGQAPTTVALALGCESVLTEPTPQGDLVLRHVLRLHPRTRARLDHDGPVWAVAFAPDGTRVATASADGSARVFDAVSGAELARLDHDDWVGAVVFSSDGTRVATGSADGSARVFDAASGVELACLDHDGPVQAVAFAPDGTRVVAASNERSARVFDAASGVELACLDHDDWVGAVVFSPDGARVVTGSGDCSARVFDAASGVELVRLDHDGPVWAVAFSPDGTRVATASKERSARVFDAVSGVELARLDHDGPVWAVVFSPDGTRVVTGSADGSARVFAAAAGAELARFDHAGPVWAVAFSPDGTRVATGSADGSARV
ncbi:MAG: CU044_2847 family protein, partial [Pseudonocardiaceae bacterium]